MTHRKTIYEEVKQAGIREGEDYLIRYQENSFVTIEIFSDYINEVFLPYVEQLRQNQLYAGKTTVLLCGNCSPHIDAALLQQLAMKKVRIVTFPLHSSHLFQPLDLVIFGAYKYYLKIVTTQYERGSQLDRIVRVLKSIEMATISENNRNSFLRAGLGINAQTKPRTAFILKQKLLERIEALNLAPNPERISLTKFEFINKQYF